MMNITFGKEIKMLGCKSVVILLKPHIPKPCLRHCVGHIGCYRKTIQYA